jgi:hypothetical protein
MATLASLNSYAATSVTYTPQDLEIPITAGVPFAFPYITWDLARTIGNTSVSNAKITLTHPNTTLAFPNIGEAINTITISNISPTQTTISGMDGYQDWAAVYAIANCSANTATYTAVFSDAANSANITITINGL